MISFNCYMCDYPLVIVECNCNCGCSHILCLCLSCGWLLGPHGEQYIHRSIIL